jgi:hypothetical protein
MTVEMVFCLAFCHYFPEVVHDGRGRENEAIIHWVDGRSTRFLAAVMLLQITRGASRDLHA